MKIKKNLLLMFLLLGVLSACANTTTDYQAGKTDDPYEIMKKKREYYKNLELKQKEQEKEETKEIELREEDNLKAEEEEKKKLEEAYKILEKKRKEYKN